MGVVKRIKGGSQNRVDKLTAGSNPKIDWEVKDVSQRFVLIPQ